jgi:hypothetical protein
MGTGGNTFVTTEAGGFVTTEEEGFVTTGTGGNLKTTLMFVFGTRDVDPLGVIVRPVEVEIKRILLEGVVIHNFDVHLMIMDEESIQIVTSNFHLPTLTCQEDVTCTNSGVLYFDVVIFTGPDDPLIRHDLYMFRV